MKRFTVILLALVLACMLLPSAVLAEEIASGTCDYKLTWTLDSEGVLTISGNGEMGNFDKDRNPAPWSAYADQITHVTIEPGVTRIGFDAFTGCSVASVDIPNTVTGIGSGAFANTKLTSLEIPGSVTGIGDEAFYGTYITEVTFPVTVRRVGWRIFGNDSIEETAKITVLGNAPGGLFESFYFKNAEIYYPGNNGSWTWDVEHYDAGEGCNVTWIPDYSTDGDVVLTGTCGENVTWSLSLNKTQTLTLSGSGEMYDYRVTNDVPWNDYRSSIAHVVVEEGVTSIGNVAFARTNGLMSVALPESLERIGANTFLSCYNLKEIVIPDGVTSIGTNAFDGCNNLQNVTLPAGGGLKTLEQSVFKGCSKAL